MMVSSAQDTVHLNVMFKRNIAVLPLQKMDVLKHQLVNKSKPMQLAILVMSSIVR